jgi:hypothetical protein
MSFQMDDVSKAITLAFVTIISAILTQILLRWDKARRDTRLRLLHDLRVEQTHFELVAYRARQILLSGIIGEDCKTLDARIDEVLFGDVYRDSRLVTLCAELASFGVISSGKYSKKAHTFREVCYNIVKDALKKGNSSPNWDAVEEIRTEIQKMSTETAAMTRNIHFRFSWF